MVDPTKDASGNVVATFRLPAASGASEACVVGEFNDWSPDATPMKLEGDSFVARVPLAPGRRYRFRYFLDGTRWENDWAADSYVPNEFGGNDSVIDLTGTPSDSSSAAAAPAPRKKAGAAPAKRPSAKKTAAPKKEVVREGGKATTTKKAQAPRS
ncbi:MAG: isoamylase early set domain-containing protein [Mycobacteriales bacterium]